MKGAASGAARRTHRCRGHGATFPPPTLKGPQPQVGSDGGGQQAPRRRAGGIMANV